MKVSNPKYKSWKKSRDYKIWKHNHDRLFKQYSKRNSKGKRKDVNRKIFVLPKDLSLINNFNEVVNCLEKIKSFVRTTYSKYDEVFLDMAQTESITVDALMYLLAFIKNIRSYSQKPVFLRGNLPRDTKCRELVQQSGFLDYLHSQAPSSPPTDNVKICVGDEVQGSVFGDICDFIHEKLKCDRINTRGLYNSFGEIVGNSNEHAYLGKIYNWKKWLTFARFKDNCVRIVILDTGLGIIQTIHKKFFEKFGINANHKQLLESALKGDQSRSQTKKLYRNRGLPRIRSNALNDILNNLVLITNDILYECKDGIDGAKEEKYTVLENELEGTLYYFEFRVKKE